MMMPVHLAVAFVRALDAIPASMPERAVKPYHALLLMPNWDNAQDAKNALTEMIVSVSEFTIDGDGITLPLNADEGMSDWAFAAGSYIQQM